jgi:prophage tail gpP-like protein
LSPVANPQEIAAIVANDATYANWKSIEIWRSVHEMPSYMKFGAAEPEPGTPQLMPGNPAQGTLGGQLAITGNIIVRQVAVDAKSHGAEFVLMSTPDAALTGTVQANPGQFINNTFTQMAKAVCAPLGINVLVTSAGGNQVFPRVSVQVGETAAAFMLRLSRYCNLHSVDDANGNLIWFSGTQGDAAAFVEGGNILSARLILNAQLIGNQIDAKGQNLGGSASQTGGGNAAQMQASATNPIYPPGLKPRPVALVADMPVTPTALQNYANYAVALDAVQQVDLRITVPGWFAPSGALWLNCLRAPVTVNSPMLFPAGYASSGLVIQSIRCMQDDKNGTTTEIGITNQLGLGTAGQPQM